MIWNIIAFGCLGVFGIAGIVAPVIMGEAAAEGISRKRGWIK
ncbi:MAG: hypothetical protein AAF583_02680 [Pseudomonadota bacterium]